MIFFVKQSRTDNNIGITIECQCDSYLGQIVYYKESKIVRLETAGDTVKLLEEDLILIVEKMKEVAK